MLCGVPRKLLRTINHTNSVQKKLTIGEYIIESLIDKNVKVAFCHKNNRNSPIFNIAENHNQFNIVFDEYKQKFWLSGINIFKIK